MPRHEFYLLFLICLFSKVYWIVPYNMFSTSQPCNHVHRSIGNYLRLRALCFTYIVWEFSSCHHLLLPHHQMRLCFSFTLLRSSSAMCQDVTVPHCLPKPSATIYPSWPGHQMLLCELPIFYKGYMSKNIFIYHLILIREDELLTYVCLFNVYIYFCTKSSLIFPAEAFNGLAKEYFLGSIYSHCILHWDKMYLQKSLKYVTHTLPERKGLQKLSILSSIFNWIIHYIIC